MKTVITVIVIVAILVFALKGSVKHMKGEGDCCGGGSGNKPKKVKAKHLDDHCVNRVAEALNSIDGVSAKVNLHKKNATVSFDRPVEEETLCRAVEKAGYRVLSVSDIK